MNVREICEETLKKLKKLMMEVKALQEPIVGMKGSERSTIS